MDNLDIELEVEKAKGTLRAIVGHGHWEVAGLSRKSSSDAREDSSERLPGLSVGEKVYAYGECAGIMEEEIVVVLNGVGYFVFTNKGQPKLHAAGDCWFRTAREAAENNRDGIAEDLAEYVPLAKAIKAANDLLELPASESSIEA